MSCAQGRELAFSVLSRSCQMHILTWFPAQHLHAYPQDCEVIYPLGQCTARVWNRDQDGALPLDAACIIQVSGRSGQRCVSLPPDMMEQSATCHSPKVR